MNKDKIILKYGIIILFYCTGILVLSFFNIKPNITLTVNYGLRENPNQYTQVFIDLGNGFREEDSIISEIDLTSGENDFVNDFTVTNISENYKDIKNLRIDFGISNEDMLNKEISIRSITVKNYNILLARYGPEQVSEYFTFHNAVFSDINGNYIYLTPENNDPYLIAGSEVIGLFNLVSIRNWSIKADLILFFTILYFILIFSLEKRNKIKKCFYDLKSWSRSNQKVVDTALYAAITVLCILSFALVVIMAIKSKDYGHPDENLTKHAIDYYLGYWKLPNISNPFFGDTFSLYGSSRLRESTIYYFLAGKIGLLGDLAGIASYYRIFNVLLFGILTVVVIKESRKMPYLYLFIALTPQIWYLFSYATSDAFDYFLSFFIFYEIMKKESLLNGFLESKRAISKIGALIFSGGLFAGVLLAKKNYYIILLAAFCVFLIKWIQLTKHRKKRMLSRYMLILMISGIICFARYAAEVYVYQNQKTTVVNSMQLEHSVNIQEHKGEKELALTGLNLRGHGITVSHLFKELKFGGTLFMSLTGVYGWMKYYGDTVYYIAFTMLYSIIACIYIWYLSKKRNYYDLILGIIPIAMVAFSFGIILWQSWTADFQPQGRYMLPVFPIIGYGIYKTVGNTEGAVVRIATIMAHFLGLYSFIIYGIYNLL